MFKSLRFGPGPKISKLPGRLFLFKKFLPGKHVEKPEGMELIPIKRRFIKNFLRKYNIPKSERFVKFFCRIRIDLKALTEKFYEYSGSKKRSPAFNEAPDKGELSKNDSHSGPYRVVVVVAKVFKTTCLCDIDFQEDGVPYDKAQTQTEVKP